MPSEVYLRPDGQWHARLCKQGRQIHLGYRATREDADLLLAAARGIQDELLAAHAPKSQPKYRKRDLVTPTPEMIDQILAALPEELAQFALVAAYSGLRLHEVDRIHPEDIRWVDGVDGACRLMVRGKGGYVGESWLFEPGLSALMARLPKQGGRRVWATKWTRQKVNLKWVAARRGLGMPEGFCFHRLRSFHCVWLLNAGVADLDVSKQLRHRDNGELVRSVYGRDVSREHALMRVARVVSTTKELQNDGAGASGAAGAAGARAQAGDPGAS